MHGIGNRIKAYALVWYDYPKSDGLTRGVDYKIKCRKGK